MRNSILDCECTGSGALEHAARLDGTHRDIALAMARENLRDENEWVRAAACKLLGDQDDQTSIESLIKLVDGSSPRVAYFATMALADLMKNDGGTVRPAELTRAFESVVAMAEENANVDPAIRHSAIWFLRQSIPDTRLVKLNEHASVDVRRAAVAALRGQGSGQVKEFLRDGSSLVVTEAAMAIHDEPIPVAEESLVDLLESGELPVDSDALLRRVLAPRTESVHRKPQRPLPVLPHRNCPPNGHVSRQLILSVIGLTRIHGAESPTSIARFPHAPSPPRVRQIRSPRSHYQPESTS